MTEQTNTELIAAAEQLAKHSSVSAPEHANMLRILAERLEATDQRADLADADLDVELDKNAAYRAKNDQLAAVVEKVREWADEAIGYGKPSGDTVSDLLATAPADALRELKAAVWDEGAEMGHRLYAEPMHVIEARNPYREEADRG